MTAPLTYHEGHDPNWFDAQYNLRAGRPDYEETVIPGWMADSQTERETLDCVLDGRYGAWETHKLTVVRCGDDAAPALARVHRG